MCGIFGLAFHSSRSLGTTSSLTQGPGQFIRTAFEAGQARGRDGSGLFAVKGDGSVLLRKAAVCGSDFVKAPYTWFSNFTANIFVGHNRASTMGRDTDENAHPFEFEHVVGVHNGTVGYYHLSDMPGYKYHPVDSATIYHSLNAVDDPLEVLSVLGGAYALVWFDKRTNMLHMARNSERPLWLMNIQSGLAFASEPHMVGWLAVRAGLIDKNTTATQINTHTLYSFPLNNFNDVTVRRYSFRPKTSSNSWWEEEGRYSYWQGGEYYEGSRRLPAPRHYPAFNSNSYYVNRQNLDAVMEMFPTLLDSCIELDALASGSIKASRRRSFRTAVVGPGDGSSFMTGVIYSPEDVLTQLPVRIPCNPHVRKELEDLIAPDETGDIWFPVVNLPCDVYSVTALGDVIPNSQYLSSTPTVEFQTKGLTDDEIDVLEGVMNWTRSASDRTSQWLRDSWEALRQPIESKD